MSERMSGTCQCPVTREDGICDEHCEGPDCSRCYVAPVCGLDLPCPLHADDQMTVIERDDVSDAELAELDQLDREATPGPWVSGEPMSRGPTEMVGGWTKGGTEHPDWDGTTSWLACDKADADFIAASRSALPRLISSLRRAREWNKAWEYSAGYWTRTARQLESQLRDRRAMHDEVEAERDRLRADLDAARAQVTALIEAGRTALYWLARAYVSGHREGWEDGPSVNETMYSLLALLANHGFDPQSESFRRLLREQHPHALHDEIVREDGKE